jgi:hypothetical protein
MTTLWPRHAGPKQLDLTHVLSWRRGGVGRPSKGRDDASHLLLDTYLWGYRLEDIWALVRSADRERARRLGFRGFLARHGRRVVRAFEGDGAVLNRVREEILDEERDLGHAQSTVLDHWLSPPRRLSPNELAVHELEEGPFRDLLGLPPGAVEGVSLPMGYPNAFLAPPGL